TPSPAPYTTHSSIWCQSSRYPSAFCSFTQAKTSRLAAIASASLLLVPTSKFFRYREVFITPPGAFLLCRLHLLNLPRRFTAPPEETYEVLLT
ncbi:unnamed protein product, partial [Laminaria digitata]